MGERKTYPIDCPLSVAQTFLARAGHWRLPVLTGIINCPTLREDGSILEELGYDANTGLLFDPQGCEFLRVAERPSREDAKKALAVLQDLLKGFLVNGQAIFGSSKFCVHGGWMVFLVSGCPMRRRARGCGEDRGRPGRTCRA
jgi:hypothetical protein